MNKPDTWATRNGLTMNENDTDLAALCIVFLVIPGAVALVVIAVRFIIGS